MGLLKKLIKKTVRKTVRKITQPIRAKAHGEQGERKVDSALNPWFFGKVEHRQINNLIVLDHNGKSHQIDHIEIRENGIFCIETKSYIGLIVGNENSNKWTQCLYTGEKYQFLNPIKQNQSHCYHLSKILGPRYIINSLVVMVRNNADSINCPIVINLSDLKGYLYHFDNGVHFSIEEMDWIYNTLLSASSGMTNRDHVENIRQTQRDLNNNICPRCGGQLVLRQSKTGNMFYGCSNYPNCRFIKK